MSQSLRSSFEFWPWQRLERHRAARRDVPLPAPAQRGNIPPKYCTASTERFRSPLAVVPRKPLPVARQHMLACVRGGRWMLMAPIPTLPRQNARAAIPCGWLSNGPTGGANSSTPSPRRVRPSCMRRWRVSPRFARLKTKSMAWILISAGPPARASPGLWSMRSLPSWQSRPPVSPASQSSGKPWRIVHLLHARIFHHGFPTPAAGFLVRPFHPRKDDRFVVFLLHSHRKGRDLAVLHIAPQFSWVARQPKFLKVAYVSSAIMR